MNTQPKLTVAICAYNAALFIKETLHSIIGQTLQSFELLIINDCSTDNTSEIIGSVLIEYKHRVINLSKNHGIAHARQMALEEAQTEYIIFIDADDIAKKTLLEEEYNIITSDSNIIAVSSWSKYIDIKGQPLWGGIFIGSKSREEFMAKAQAVRLIFLPINTMINREAALRAGGFRLNGFPNGKPRYRDYCEDLDLWTRMSDLYTEGKYIITIPKVLYLYRKGNSGISSYALNMIIKMRFIKYNLKLRRSGHPEITFTRFYENLSAEEIKGFKQEAKAGYYLRNSVFEIKRLNVIKWLYYLSKSIIISPRYFWQKLKTNSKIIK